MNSHTRNFENHNNINNNNKIAGTNVSLNYGTGKKPYTGNYSKDLGYNQYSRNNVTFRNHDNNHYYGYNHDYGSFYPWWLYYYPADWWLYPDRYPVPSFWWRYSEIPYPPNWYIKQYPTLKPPVNAIIPKRLLHAKQSGNIASDKINDQLESFSESSSCYTNVNIFIFIVLIVILLFILTIL